MRRPPTSPGLGPAGTAPSIRPAARVLLLAGALSTALTALAACGSNRADAPREDDVSPRSIEEVQEAHTPGWMGLPGVVGTGIGLCEGEPCIRVFLSQPSPEAERAIPDTVEGHRVELEVTGEFRPGPPPDTASGGPDRSG